MNEFGRGSCWRRRNGRDQHQADGKVEMGHISCRQCAGQELSGFYGQAETQHTRSRGRGVDLETYRLMLALPKKPTY